MDILYQHARYFGNQTSQADAIRGARSAFLIYFLFVTDMPDLFRGVGLWHVGFLAFIAISLRLQFHHTYAVQKRILGCG